MATRTIVLTYLAGDCGGLFLLSCCRQKSLDALKNITFIPKRIDRQKPNAQDDDENNNSKETTEVDKKTSCEAGNTNNETPSGTYPTIECAEVGLSVSGVLLSLYALGTQRFVVFFVLLDQVEWVCTALLPTTATYTS